jgi:choline dehydrogenase-like flavoprotein
MTPPTFDVIIVGSGPAGVSAAFPLVEAGLKVLMVDGGHKGSMSPPSKPFLTERAESENQWKWMVGEDFHALKKLDAVSPKLRVPTHAYVFEDFIAKNHIQTDNFVAVGSLATGGLSNAWGCGVARLSASELADFPFPSSEIERSYETVTRRIGVSGANADDLSEYFGLDAWAQPPIEMDDLHQQMHARYLLQREKLLALEFHLGRSRVTALSQDLGDRKACDLSGNCLWGCDRRALYSATDELPSLMKHNNFTFRNGFIVEHVSKGDFGVSIEGQDTNKHSTLVAQKLILAAGTLASTRLALDALNFYKPVNLQSCPIAAFLLWLPQKLGRPKSNSFGFGQLSYSLKLQKDISAFGSTFSTSGIPVAEFVRHLPLRKRYGIDLLRVLLSSCLVGNMFLPGHLSTAEASLSADGLLKICGGYSDRVPALMSQATSQLRKAYWRLGALLLPMSFTVGLPGGDIHYASTLPMCHKPKFGETNAQGELAGLEGVHIVDGSILPTLCGKSHTLTIMANADRIGKAISGKIKS